MQRLGFIGLLEGMHFKEGLGGVDGGMADWASEGSTGIGSCSDEGLKTRVGEGNKESSLFFCLDRVG